MSKYVTIFAGILSVGAFAFVYTNQSAAPSLGATAVQATNGNCLIGPAGGQECVYHKAMANASTTFQIKSPNATTTLSASSFCTLTGTNGSTFDTEWGYSSTIDATTTRISLNSTAITSGSQGTFVASSSPGWTSNRDSSLVIPPNSYVAFKIGSSSPANITGYCDAVLNQ